jgi:hypothetical protein
LVRIRSRPPQGRAWTRLAAAQLPVNRPLAPICYHPRARPGGSMALGTRGLVPGSRERWPTSRRATKTTFPAR